ncbi:hypothetical protein [Ruania halotolerans]|uniref:hypothetical protein n=1 Tax=Ruania halotolerans TaxID=2897773 RepID=UPI001E536912|nr:hypothetical protein [Ruania halotolerans]UFU05835.1 hypothetical protein LQF10_15580 [Ruania halotolerans]
MAIDHIQRELNDHRSFGKSLRINRASVSVASLLFIFGIVAVLWNLRSTLRTLNNDYSTIGSPRFWRVFWSTLGENDAVTALLYATVYGGPILLILAVALFLYSAVSRNSLYGKLYRDYLDRGYLALARETGLRVSENKKSGSISVDLLTHPSLSQQDNESLLGYVRQQVGAGGPQVVQWVTALGKSKALDRPVSLAQIIPGTPDGPLLSASKHERRAVVVINPKPGEKVTALRTYDVK